MNPSTTKKTIPVSATERVFLVPAIKLRQPDGSLLVKAGRPEMAAQEITVTQFNKETGVSKRHIVTLCEQGLIQHRRMTPKQHSKILIPRSEVTRYLSLDDEACERATMPAGDLAVVHA